MKIQNMAKYLLDLSLLDSKMNQYLPSVLAAASLYTAMRVDLVAKGQSQESCWSKELQRQTGFTTSQLKPCAKNYFHLCDLIQRSELQEVNRKYSANKYEGFLKMFAEVCASR